MGDLARLRTVVLVGMLLGAAQLSRFASGDYAIDDAWISFRTARTWLEGGGLTFNAGELPVEGMTNLAWTLLSSVWIALAPSLDPIFGARVVGALLYLASIAIAARLAFDVSEEHGGQPLVAAAVTIAVAVASGSLAYHSMSGLETALWGFGFVLSLALANRARHKPSLWPWAGCSLGLLAATRPEGVAVAILLCGAAAFAYGGAAWRMGFVAGSIVAAMEAFRLGYYGSLVPNTFHAKPPNAALGFEYAREYAIYGIGFVGALAWFVCSRRVPRSRVLAALAVLLVAGAIWSGGDWMAGHRRFTLVTWLAALGAGVGVSMRSTRLLASVAAIACVIAPIAGALRGVDAERVPMDFMGTLGLRAEASQVDGVALVDVGRFGWMYRGEIFDLVGLTDRRVARRPGGFNEKQWDEAYFRGRNPALVFVRIESELGDPLAELPRVAQPEKHVLRSILENGGYYTRAFHPFADDRVYVMFARDDVVIDPEIWGPVPAKGLEQLIRERYYLDRRR